MSQVNPAPSPEELSTFLNESPPARALYLKSRGKRRKPITANRKSDPLNYKPIGLEVFRRATDGVPPVIPSGKKQKGNGPTEALSTALKCILQDKHLKSHAC